MTKLESEKAMSLLETLLQRTVNGHPYINMEVRNIDYCGGFEIVIKDIPILQDNDILSIITVANKTISSFQLHLNEGLIKLI